MLVFMTYNVRLSFRHRFGNRLKSTFHLRRLLCLLLLGTA
jgi:hypothetical protein